MALTRAQQARLVSSLQLAQKILVLAALVQMSMFLPESIAPADKTFGFALVVSAVLGIVGFLIPYRQLDLGREAREDAPSFVGPNLRGIVLLTFLGAFLVPLVNLVIFAWAFFKCSAARKKLAAERQFEDTLESRRARLRSG